MTCSLAVSGVGITLALSEDMELKKTAPTSRANERGQAVPPASTNANRPTWNPQGTLDDQVNTMEGEGQGQTQSDAVPLEPRPKGIPPLLEPDVDGVGEESGPSAGTNTATLDPSNPKPP